MNGVDTPIWVTRHFSELTPLQLYQLVRLRIDVFVVEQHCAYAELDGRDHEDGTIHVFATLDNAPVAYARILAPQGFDTAGGSSTPETVYIGRVVVAKVHRRRGLASALMQRALTCCEQHYPTAHQALSAQVQVQEFYASLGFVVCSDEYMEDGIAHVDMRRQNNTKRWPAT